jgi:hypothetical protein
MTPNRPLVRALVLLGVPLFMCSGCGGSGSSVTAPSTTSTTSTTSTIRVLSAPATLTLAVGDTTQVRAVATMTDGSMHPITNGATWQSSNASVLTVSASGVVTGISAGTASITVAAGGQTATISATASATGSATTTFLGTAAGPGSLSGTLTLSVATTSRALGMFYTGSGAPGLLGRLDSPSNVVNVTGGGYSFLGTIVGSVLSGTVTDPAGNTGGFSALDSTHSAVTAYCGTYSSDGTTAAGNADSGTWNLQISFGGIVSAERATQDGSSPALLYSGQVTGSSIALVSGGLGATGTLSGDTASGTSQTAAGGVATFTATTGACH